ncbi:MAG TPA: NAD(P)/FAD-dependent oxidoreductase, partial [Methylocystis sp.]
NLVRSMFSAPPSFAATAQALASTPGGMARERFSLQSVRSWANETFETEVVRSLFGAFGLFVGSAPDDAGGAEIAWLFGALLQQTGNNLVRGGMHQVSRALARVLAEHGGEIRTSAVVDRILVDNNRARGVRLATGEEIGAREVVVSCADPGQLVNRFLGAEVVGKEIADAMATYEWGDATMAMYVALDRPVEFAAGLELRQAAHVHLSPPSIGAMAEAMNQCRAGELPNAPFVVAWNESTIDPSRAPEGKALMKFVVLGTPWNISGDATEKVAARDWDAAKEPYAAHLLESIERDYLPGLRQHILKCAVHSPVDMNRKLSSAVKARSGTARCCPIRKVRCVRRRAWGNTAPRFRTSILAIQVAIPAPASPWRPATMRRRRFFRILSLDSARASTSCSVRTKTSRRS